MMNANNDLNKDDINEKKVDAIKYRILELETDNIVKKEPSTVMVDKIYRTIMTEVDRR